MALLAVLPLLPLTAQTQKGYVKTKGRLGADGRLIAGTPLQGATIMLGTGNATHSSAQGTFSIKTRDGRFTLSKVMKDGYELVDAEVLRGYRCSSNVLVISMESRLQQRTDRSQAARQVRDQLNRRIERQRAEIERLREENRLTEEKYEEALNRLLDMEDTNQRLVERMADEYSKIDYDLIDEWGREFNRLFLAGELERADSLLKSRGDIHADIEELSRLTVANAEVRRNLQQSEAMEQVRRNDIADRCKKQHELFLMEHEMDSAAYYICLRAELDTANVQWQQDAGRFLHRYLNAERQALDLFLRAYRNAVAQQGENCAEVATALNNIGLMYNELEDTERSLAYYERSLAIKRQLTGVSEDDLGLATTLNNIGMLYLKMKDYGKARSYIEQSLETWKQTGDQDDKSTLTTCYNNLGLLCCNQGDTANARRYYESALAIYLEEGKDDHPDVALLCNNLGSLSINRGDYGEAIDYFQRALGIWRAVYGERHAYVAICLSNIGKIYEDQEDYAKAIDYYKQSREIMLAVYGEGHQTDANTCVWIGRCYFASDDYDAALTYLSRALDVRLKLYGEQSERVAGTYSSIGACYVEKHEFDRARDYLQRATDICTALGSQNEPLLDALQTNKAKLERLEREQQTNAQQQP